MSKSCIYGAMGRPSIAVWGDSHGVELIAAMTPWLTRHHKAAIQLSYSSCAPVAPKEVITGCDRFNRDVLLELIKNPNLTHVVMVGATDSLSYRHNDAWRSGFLLAAQQLLRSGKHIVLVYPVPSQIFPVPRALANSKRFGISLNDSLVTRFDYIKRTATVFATYDSLGEKGVTRVYPDRILCQGGVCQVAFDGRPLYFDDNHLSLFGAQQLVSSVADGLAGDGPFDFVRQ